MHERPDGEIPPAAIPLIARTCFARNSYFLRYRAWTKLRGGLIARYPFCNVFSVGELFENYDSRPAASATNRVKPLNNCSAAGRRMRDRLLAD